MAREEMLPPLALAALAQVRPSDPLPPGGELPPQQVEQASPAGSLPDDPDRKGSRPSALHTRDLHGASGKTADQVQRQAVDGLEQIEGRPARNRQQPYRPAGPQVLP